MFVGLILLRRMPFFVVISVLLLVVAIAVVLPPHVFAQLQGSRDSIFNVDRIGRALPGARTAFANVYPPDSFFHFIANYVYAALRLNFPFFSGVTPRDIYLFANVILFAWIAIAGFRSDLRTFDNTALFVSHVLVSICFEPDVGSYLRHISSAMPYLVPAVVVVDRLWLAGDQAHDARGAAGSAADRSSAAASWR
jgi:hypothetical protein